MLIFDDFSALWFSVILPLPNPKRYVDHREGKPHNLNSHHMLNYYYHDPHYFFRSTNQTWSQLGCEVEVDESWLPSLIDGESLLLDLKVD
jgi:hypothetical protein